jgi:hypothetical protein
VRAAKSIKRKAGKPEKPSATAKAVAAGGGKAMVDPRDQQNMKPVTEPFEVVMRIDNSNLEIMPGQRANIRFTVDRASVLSQAWRRILQMIQVRDLHSKWT